MIYTHLLTSGKLCCYLMEMDAQAKDMFFRLVMQMAKVEGITEELKNPTKWYGLAKRITSELVSEK